MSLREKGAITGVGETAYSRESGRSVHCNSRHR